MITRSLILCFLLLLPVADPAGADDTLRVQRLLAGEVIVRSAEKQGAPGAASAQALMDAPARRIWDTLLSCEQARIYVRDLQHCEVLEFDGRYGRINHVIDQPWPLGPLDIVFESEYQPFRSIDSRLVTGNLAAFEAAWRFSETAQGVLVEYTVALEPAYPVPAFVVRHYIRKRLPDMMACLRALSDASGSTEQRQTDRARCHGDSD